MFASNTMSRTNSRLLAGFILCGIFFLAVARIVWIFSVPMFCDQLLFLQEASRWLSGMHLYGNQIIETNPPIIIYFSALPVWLARVFRSPLIGTFATVVGLMIVGSTLWCVRILGKNAKLANPLAALVISCAILYEEMPAPIWVFGQREHLGVLLLLPYMMATLTGVVERISTAERCALGLAASLAIWLKPHETLLIVTLELFLILRQRSLRRLTSPEALTLTITSVVILALCFMAAPAYFHDALPILGDTYWALGTLSFSYLVLSFPQKLIFLAFTLLFCKFAKRHLRDRTTIVGLALCSIVAKAEYAVQHTPWAYHLYPHQILSIVTATYLAVDLAYPLLTKYLPSIRLVLIPAAACVAVVLVAVGLMIRDGGFHRVPLWQPIGEYLKTVTPGTTVNVFTTNGATMGEAIDNGLIWGSGAESLWMLPSILQNEVAPLGNGAPFKRLTPGRLQELSAIQHRRVVDDLEFWKPSIVIVERCNHGVSCEFNPNIEFDMLSWLERDPEFKDQWVRYEHIRDFKTFSVYSLRR